MNRTDRLPKSNGISTAVFTWSFCWQELLFKCKNMRNFSAKQKINRGKNREERMQSAATHAMINWCLIMSLLIHANYNCLWYFHLDCIFLVCRWYDASLKCSMLSPYALCVVLRISFTIFFVICLFT